MSSLQPNQSYFAPRGDNNSRPLPNRSDLNRLLKVQEQKAVEMKWSSPAAVIRKCGGQRKWHRNSHTENLAEMSVDHVEVQHDVNFQDVSILLKQWDTISKRSWKKN